MLDTDWVLTCPCRLEMTELNAFNSCDGLLTVYALVVPPACAMALASITAALVGPFVVMITTKTFTPWACKAAAAFAGLAYVITPF